MRAWMLGCLVGLVASGWASTLPGVTARLLALAAVAAGLRWRALAAIAGLGCGVLVATLAGSDLLQRRLPLTCEQQPLWVEGPVVSLPAVRRMPSGELRRRFRLQVDALTPANCAGPGTLLLSWYGGPALTAGERWRLPVRLRRPWGLQNPGSRNMQGWYASAGIDALGSVRTGRPRLLAPARGTSGWHHRLRQQVSETQQAMPLSARARGLLRALTVGDRSGLEGADWTLFRHLGISHLLVISGLHIGMVALPGLLLGAALARGLWLLGVATRPGLLPAILGSALALAYAALAGFSLPTQRALVMLGCFLWLGVLGRRASGAGAWLLAALLILVASPLAALGSSLWLSFLAVASLLWFNALSGGRRGWRQWLAAHAYMSLVMLPLGGWWFGGASLIAAPVNLLLVPMVGFFVVPLCLLGLVAAPMAPLLSQQLYSLGIAPLEVFLSWPWLQPGSPLYLSVAGAAPELALAALGIAVATLPGSQLRRGAALALCLPLLLPPVPAADDSALSVTVLDVGQGSAVLLRQGQSALLYDTGGGDPQGRNRATEVILPYLRRRGIAALDTLVISHPDLDHSAGAGTLLAALPVAQVLYGGARVPVAGAVPCVAGRRWRWPGGVGIRVLAPATGEAGLDRNDGSCVLQVAYAGYRLLLPGDISARRERQLVRYWREDLRSEWLLAAHHGSRSSSSRVWLKTVQPDTVIYSHGYRNRFGHPHPRVQDRVNAVASTSYSTAGQGAVHFRITAGRVVVRLGRNRNKPYWM